MLLYKYREINKYSLDIILNNRLYLANVLALNDPFDVFLKNFPNIKFHDKSYNVTNIMENIKVCSLSSIKDSILMWSHYSDSHRGLVFELETENAEKLNYVPEIKLLNSTGIKVMHLMEEKDIPIEEWKEYFCQKINYWEYESEYRIVENGRNYQQAIIKKLILGSDFMENTLENLLLLEKIIRIAEEKEIKIEWFCLNNQIPLFGTTPLKPKIESVIPSDLIQAINEEIRNRMR